MASKEARKLGDRIETLESSLKKHPLAKAADLRERLALAQKRTALEEAVAVSRRPEAVTACCVCVAARPSRGSLLAW